MKEQTLGIVGCINCGRSFPEVGLPYVCPTCGGTFDYLQPWEFDPDKVDEKQPGIWKYRATFGMPPDTEPITLGEGNTPLIWAKSFNREVAFKCEYLNPTGSFKDRGSAVLAAWLRFRGIEEIIEDSSGNAGASLAAYASRAKTKARIFIPENASGPKRLQIKAMGVDMVPVVGTRNDVANAARQAVGKGNAYASHAYLPFNLPGYATVAYEIYRQLGNHLPGAVIVPAGQGGFLLGIWRGFDSLVDHLEKRVNNDFPAKADFPRMVGVQARACAPLWALYVGGTAGLGFVTENPTLAEGVKIIHPVRGDAILRLFNNRGVDNDKKRNQIVAVDEDKILPGQEALARMGFWVEPTSALVWDALEQIISQLPDPIVVLLTGSGYKYK
jgi:threonine synthase